MQKSQATRNPRPRKRTRLTRQTDAATAGGGRGTTFGFVNTDTDVLGDGQRWLDERMLFANTIHARNPGENRPRLTGVHKDANSDSDSAPSQTHADHPPSVVWKLQATRDLSVLGRAVEYASRPPGGIHHQTPRRLGRSGRSHASGPPLSASNQRRVIDGSWYAPPQLSRALAYSTTHGGFGDKHVAVPEYLTPSTTATGRHNEKGTLTRNQRVSKLGAAQRVLLEGQSGAYRNFAHRVQKVIRNLRRQNRNGCDLEAVPNGRRLPSRWFTLGEFMQLLEQETGYRLVYVQMGNGGSSETPTHDAMLSDVRLGYALERGGRYFVAVCWPRLPRPTQLCEFARTSARGNDDKHRFVWWGNTGVGPKTNPVVFSYTCRCKV